MLSITLFLFVALFSSSHGARITVDDADPAWTYSYPWNAITPSQPCPDCQSRPDTTQALKGTWHDTAFVNNNATLSFTGIAIEIYTICPGLFYGNNFTFQLDDSEGGFFAPIPACPTFTYHYLVYARTNLTLGQHTFTITNEQVNSKPNTSNLLLDYAVYDNGESESSSTSTFPLVAVVIPTAVAGLLLPANIILYLLYRRSERKYLENIIAIETTPANDLQRPLIASSPVISDATTPTPFIIDQPPVMTQPSFPHAPATMPRSITNENTMGLTGDPRPEPSLYTVTSIPTSSSSRYPENAPFTITTVDPRVAGTSALPSSSTSASSPEPTATWAPDVKPQVTSPSSPDWLPPGYQGHWRS